jgi:hypothetical protein
MFKTGGSPDLKRLKNQAVICKNQILPPTLISVDTRDTREGGNKIMSASWASHLYTEEICGCVEKAGVGGHSTQGTFTCT